MVKWIKSIFAWMFPVPQEKAPDATPKQTMKPQPTCVPRVNKPPYKPTPAPPPPQKRRTIDDAPIESSSDDGFATSLAIGYATNLLGGIIGDALNASDSVASPHIDTSLMYAESPVYEPPSIDSFSCGDMSSGFDGGCSCE